jgi:hypothetical protein
MNKVGHNKVLFKICDQVGRTYFSTSRSMEIYENPTLIFPKIKISMHFPSCLHSKTFFKCHLEL